MIFDGSERAPAWSRRDLARSAASQVGVEPVDNAVQQVQLMLSFRDDVAFAWIDEDELLCTVPW